MLHLFERDNIDVKIHAEAYLVDSISKLAKLRRKDENRLTKELKFVFHYCDYRSQFDAQEDQLKWSSALYASGLEGNWKPDDAVKAVISEYKHTLDKLVPTTKLLRTGRQALNDVSDSLDTLVSEIRSVRKDIEKRSSKTSMLTPEVQVKFPDSSPKFQKIGEHTDPNVKMVASDEHRLILLERLSALNEKAIVLIAKVPDMIKNLEKILQQVKKEESEAVELRGGGKKGNREDPK